jgi:hypothetical protein
MHWCSISICATTILLWLNLADFNGLSKNAVKFYIRQNEMVEKFMRLDAMGKKNGSSGAAEETDDDEHAPWPVRALVSASFFTNVVCLSAHCTDETKTGFSTY